MFIKNIYNKLSDRRWTIGFLQNSIESVIRGEELRVQWMRHNYKDRWFADPFILDVDDSYIHVLAEEYYMPIKRAYIAKLTIDKKSKTLIDTTPILKLNTHLSYPAIIRSGKEIFVYPESGQSGKLILYKYDFNTEKLIEYRELLKEDVGDATYTNLFGEDLLFCTKPPLYNDNLLYIYRKENGRFVYSERIVFNDNIARMAGDFFTVNGKVYRPAQDCNKSYGNGLVIQEVNQYQGKWNFKELHRYYSPNLDYPLGIHTFNMYKEVITVDAVGYWHPTIAKFLTFLKSCFYTRISRRQ